MNRSVSTFLTSSAQIYSWHCTPARTWRVLPLAGSEDVCQAHCGITIHSSAPAESQPQHRVPHREQHRLHRNQRWAHPNKCGAAVTGAGNHRGRATSFIILLGSWKEGVVSGGGVPRAEFISPRDVMKGQSLPQPFAP